MANNIKLNGKMVDNTAQDRKAKIIILVFTLVLTVLFVVLGALRLDVELSYDDYNNNPGSGLANITVSGTLYTGSNSVYVYGNGDYTYYRFTPSYSRTYTFYSSASNFDSYGAIYDSDMYQLFGDDDSGDNRNFRFSAYLRAGNTYYLGVKKAGSISSSGQYITVYIEY